MMKFRHPSKQSSRRVNMASDNLSIIPAGRPIIKVGRSEGSSSRKRVRKEHENLQKKFAIGRAAAYERKGARVPGSYTPSNNQLPLYSPYFGNDSCPTSSLKFPVPPPQPENPVQSDPPPSHSGAYTTISSLHSAVSSQDKRRPRGILKPVGVNQTLSNRGHAAAVSQGQYWSLHANTGRVKKRKVATLHSLANMNRGGSTVSSWRICSSMQMTRTTAPLVQNEMVSTMCSGESSASSTSSHFSPFFPANQGQPVWNQNTTSSTVSSTPYVPSSSLLSKVLPPHQSPLVPTTPTLENIGVNDVFQSEWMDRSKCVGRAPTKQYSMEQIIDIVCGFATPDSKMAAQLFQPLPSASLSVEPLTTTGFKEPEPLATNTYNSNIWPSVNQNQSNFYENNSFQIPTTESSTKKNNDEGETSIYFQDVPKKKSVSFLTDSMDNICVTKHVFDPFSQDNSGTGSSNDNSSLEKENIEPNFFGNVLPPPSQTNLSQLDFFPTNAVSTSSSNDSNLNPLPELSGSLFNSPSINVPETAAEVVFDFV